MKIRDLFLLSLILSQAACLPQTKEIPTTPKTAAPPTTPAISSTPPILQIDPGGHKALIRDVTFTPDGRYLVSASNDKLIRVWDLETGKTVRTLRGQISAGDEGKIFAMALSPDGRWLAAAGFMGISGNEPIRLYDFTSGKLVTLLKGHTNVVLSLAFSPDNRYLVSGQGGSYNQVAIIWDVQRHQKLHTLHGHTDRIYAVAFTPDSQRVVTGSLDHSLRLWQVQDGGLITTLKGHTNKVYAVAISPQEDIIASGSDDYTIHLWDGRTGQFIKTLANQGTQVGSLSFSPDGRYLVSGVSSAPTNCHVWSIPDGKEIVTYRGHDNIVLATAVSPDGRVVATGGGNKRAIHLWSLRDGKLQQRLSGVGAGIWAVGFSSDGSELGWGKIGIQQPNQAGKLEYTITLPSKSKGLDSKQFLGTPRKLSGSNRDFSRAQDKWRDWTLRTRKGGNYGYQAILDIRQQNRTVASIERGATDGYDHRSYTFTPDGERIISGGMAGVLTAYNRDGNKLGDFVGHTGDIWAVAVSSDGRLLASGSADQTVRLWDIETRENLLTLFHGSDDEWVAWTPTGHYTASVNGDKMVGWQINRGVDKVPDYVTATQLPNLYRPDVIANAIRLRSVKKAIAQTGAHFNLARLQRELPPRFEIVAPQSGSKIEKGIASVVLNIAENTLAIQRFEVYVNSRLVTPQKVRKINPIITRHKRTLEVPLETGENRISILAFNDLGKTTTQVTVFYDGESKIREGTLHLVSIGVSAYPNLSKEEQLDFAAIDAQAIYKKLKATGQKQYRDIKSVLISDNQGKTPNKSNIETALQALNPKKEDTTILFLAGHGINLAGEYFFMPKGAERQGSKLNKKSLVPWKILQDAIANSQGRRILLVDTCHAGKAFNPRLLKDAANKNIVVLNATSADTVSREMNQFGHGVFTYALLEGLKGEADITKFDGAGKITFNELNTYVTDMVKYLTKNRQIPISQASSDGFVDFTFVQL